jgi:hypothetical protein
MRKIKSIISLIILSVVVMSSFIYIKTSIPASADPARWLLCRWETGALLLNFTRTDYLPYMFRSKTTSATTQRVDRGLNMLLQVAGYPRDNQTFQDVNECVLNRPLDITEADPDWIADCSGAPYTIFDRFGVAGLRWTTYFGEWKYFWIDACAPDASRISATQFGVFYPDRQEVRDTYGEISRSPDIRGQHFQPGFPLRAWVNTWLDIFSNFLFNIAKFIITLTIVFVGLALGDVPKLIGLAGDYPDGAVFGIFGDLYSQLFIPLSVLFFIITGGYVIYKGMIRREFRETMNRVLMALFCFFIAVMIAARPGIFIRLPHQLATIAQALIISALVPAGEDGTNLCTLEFSPVGTATNIITGEDESAAFDGPDIDAGLASSDLEENRQTLMEQIAQISEQMRATLGCRIWEEFLFNPWVQGQFGTTNYRVLDHSETCNRLADVYLGDDGEIIIGRDSSLEPCLPNRNVSWTGFPAVPKNPIPEGEELNCDAGDIICNWAVFNLSTMTNAHYSIARDSNVPILVDGVSNDWWRIADALSNYDIGVVETMQNGSPVRSFIRGFDFHGDRRLSIDDGCPECADPLNPYWEVWIGNRAGERFGTAFFAIFFGTVGVIGLLVFAAASAMFSVLIVFLMALSPVFFLFGCWAGKGQEIFRSWLEMLVKAMIKMILCSALLVISFAFTIAIIALAHELGTIRAFILLAITTLIFVKNKNAILEHFSKIDFGGTFKPDGRVKNKLSRVGKTTAMVAGGAVIGAYKGGRSGYGVLKGAKTAAGSMLADEMRTTTFGRNVMMQQRQTQMKNGNNSEEFERRCNSCGIELNSSMNVKQDTFTMMFYCENCALDQDNENLVEVSITNFSKNDDENINPNDPASPNIQSNVTLREWAEGIKDEDGNLNRELAQQFAEQNMENLKVDIAGHQEQMYRRDSGVGSVRAAIPPSIPEPLLDYIDPKTIYALWEAGNHEAVEEMYREAWDKNIDDLFGSEPDEDDSDNNDEPTQNNNNPNDSDSDDEEFEPDEYSIEQTEDYRQRQTNKRPDLSPEEYNMLQNQFSIFEGGDDMGDKNDFEPIRDNNGQITQWYNPTTGEIYEGDMHTSIDDNVSETDVAKDLNESGIDAIDIEDRIKYIQSINPGMSAGEAASIANDDNKYNEATNMKDRTTDVQTKEQEVQTKLKQEILNNDGQNITHKNSVTARQQGYIDMGYSAEEARRRATDTNAVNKFEQEKGQFDSLSKSEQEQQSKNNSQE